MVEIVIGRVFMEVTLLNTSHTSEDKGDLDDPPTLLEDSRINFITQGLKFLTYSVIRNDSSKFRCAFNVL